MSEWRRTSLATFLAWAALVPTAPAVVIHVPADSPTIQQAIVQATDGDTILVSPGTYFESIDLLGKGLVLASTGGAAVTIIDAAAAGRVVTVASGEPAGTTLRGFTLRNGRGQPITFDLSGGAGVHVNGNSHVVLMDCVIAANESDSVATDFGGGVLVQLGTAELVGCTLSGNVADAGAALATIGSGGTATLTHCSIVGNIAQDVFFGAAVNAGAGVALSDCLVAGNTGSGLLGSAAVHDCEFTANTGWGWGTDKSWTNAAADCRFLGNGLGGLSISSYSDLVFCGPGNSVTRCTFAGGDTLSASSTCGGATIVTQCTFDGGGLAASNTDVTLRNCILRNGVTITNATPHMTYCDVQGGWPGVGNIDADPAWADAALNDYRLLPGSPCINAGDPASPLDADGSHADMGAVPYEPWTSLGGGVSARGEPALLEGDGPLVAGTSLTISLSGAPPLQAVTLVAGTSELGAPFKGGTLWPSPELILVGLPTDAAGSLRLLGLWPPGLLPGTSIVLQAWLADAGAPAQLSASNGLRGTAP